MVRGMAIEPSGYRVDDVNGDGKVDIDDKRLPLIVRIYGVMVLVDGMLSLPWVVLSAISVIREIIAGRVHVDALDLTFILSSADTVVLTVNAALLIIFGVLLLLNRRRHAARYSPWRARASLRTARTAKRIRGAAIPSRPNRGSE